MSSVGLSSLARAVRANQVGAFCDLASIVILIYDYLDTLQYEIYLIWRAPWNIGKILYCLTKYSVFIETALLAYYHFSAGHFVSAETCSTVYRTSAWFIFWGVGVAECILVFRTWAIWNRSRIVGITLLTLMIVLGVVAGFLTHAGLSRVTFSRSPIPRVQSCFLRANHDILIFVDYALILIWETFILILTIIKGVKNYRHSSSSLAAVLYEDGVLYYIYLTFFSVANVFFLVFLVDTGASLILMQRVFHSILTGRILLHLRLAVVHDRGNTSRDTSRSIIPAILTTILDREHRDKLFNAMIGADVWFSNSRSSGTASGDLELR